LIATPAEQPPVESGHSRNSDFGLLSGFGLRSSDFRAAEHCSPLNWPDFRAALRGARNGLERLGTDTLLVSLHNMITDITSKTLHEKTGQVLDRLRRGERFRVIRDGEPEGFMVPVEEAVDPEWPEIMADVLAARKQAKPVRENPVLKERKARNCAAHLC
jgi:antitoxin (DNA-binding transcriptional repressor) of toxin-antitoxin stability system